MMSTCTGGVRTSTTNSSSGQSPIASKNSGATVSWCSSNSHCSSWPMALWYILLDLFDNDFLWQSPLVNAAITKNRSTADPRRADPESRTIFGIFEKLQLFLNFTRAEISRIFENPGQRPGKPAPGQLVGPGKEIQCPSTVP